MKRLLITRSRHDPGNDSLYLYSDKIVKEAETANWQVSKADNKDNNAKEVTSRLSKNKMDLVLFHGHGTEEAVHGYNDEVLIDLNSAKLLAKSIVYAVSCSAVNGLGVQAVSEGCPAFIGYEGWFSVPQLNEYLATPLRDPSTKPVLEASNTVSHLLLKGSSVEEAVKAAKTYASKTMLKILTSEEAYDKAALTALFENSLNLTYKGNGQAKVK